MMITPGQFFRVMSIQRTLIRHGFDEVLFATPLLRSVNFLLYLLPWNWFGRSDTRARADRIRAVLEELGPLFVKAGQILSTRRDLLPDDIAEELAKLQDAVPPFSGAVARAIVERAYNRPLTEVFAAFDEQPLASASIAQVHAARLLDGREVVVKVVRPGIRTLIERDMGLLALLAAMAERYSEQGRRMRPTGVVAEVRKTVLDELDMMREAANATQLKRNMRDMKAQIHVPVVEWEWTRRDVLVTERIHGIPVADLAALRRAEVDLQALAKAGVEIFFTQVFRDHYFHADMHPGNLFVIPGATPGQARFAPVDFGIMGSLSEFDQRYLAENFMAFLARDYRRVAELHVESGWVPATTRVDDFEFAVRAVCEPILDRPMREVSFGQFLLRLFQTAQRFHMHILPQLLLLQKTLINVEGLGRQLFPDLDLWDTARPIMERWLKDRVGLASFARVARTEARHWAGELPAIPHLAFELLERTHAGQLRIEVRNAELARMRHEVREGFRRLVFTVAGVGILLITSVLLGFMGMDTPGASSAGIPLPLWLLAGLGVVLLWKGLKSEE
jgi:ubiquinone biosynthesis protein